MVWSHLYFILKFNAIIYNVKGMTIHVHNIINWKNKKNICNQYVVLIHLSCNGLQIKWMKKNSTIYGDCKKLV